MQRCASPTGIIQGRAGIVRVKVGKSVDLSVIAAYPPPSSTEGAEHVTKLLYKWIVQQVRLLPKRTPILMGIDANTKMGTMLSTFAEIERGLAQKPDCPPVGPCEPDRETSKSNQIRQILTDCGLAAASVFFNVGPMLWAPIGHLSRIDHAWITAGLLKSVDQCYVDLEGGDRLQNSRLPCRCDRRRVCIQLGAVLRYQGSTAQPLRRDFSAISKARAGGQEKSAVFQQNR